MGILGDNCMDFILMLVNDGAEKDYTRSNTRDFAERLEVSQQTISRWVCQLEEIGYIERKRLKQNSSAVRFTAQAKAELDEIRKILGVKG